MATEENEIIPSYLIAANTHSTLNDSEDSNVFDAAYDVATKFIPLSVASGAAQVYNILPTVGNWLGGEYEQFDFKKAVADYDTDLSKYYTEHQVGTDAVGFMMGSLVPGMAGVKVLNGGMKVLGGAMESGTLGSNMAKAYGLLPSSRATYIADAVKTIRETGNVFKLTEANTLKALAAGVGANALEGAAFTTAVNATMFNSPVLEGRDISDLAWDVGIGAALGGAVGGLISGVVASSTIKRAGVAAEKELAPWAITDVPAPNMKASDKILFRAQKLDEMPPLPEGDLAARAERTAKATKTKTMLDIRQDFASLTNGDESLAQALFDKFAGSNLQTNMDNYIDALSAGRVSARTATEAEIGRIKKVLKNNNFDFSKLTTDEFNLYNNTKVSYVKMRGEGIGNVSDTRPGVLNLADKTQNMNLELAPNGVKIGGKLYKHDNNPYQPYNILGATHLQTESRYLWAEKLPTWEGSKNTPVVHATDIPLLQKAFRDKIERLKVIPEGAAAKDAITLSSKLDIEKFLKKQKVELAGRLAKAETMPLDESSFVDKVKNLLGINFNVVDDNLANGFFTRIGGKVAGHDLQGDTIAISRDAIKTRSLAANVATLKHEEGHSIFQSLLDSHGINRNNLSSAYPALREEIIDISKKQRPHLWKSNDPRMVQYRESAHELFAGAFAYLSMNNKALANYPEFNRFAGHLVRPLPQEVIDSVARRASKPTSAEIAKVVDVTEANLAGTITESGWFARDAARAGYKKFLEGAGARNTNVDPMTLPSYSKIISDTSKVQNVNGMTVEITTDMTARAKLYDESAKRVATQGLGEELPDISNKELITGGDVGPKMLSFENANYGKRGAWGAYIGQRTHAIIQRFKSSTSDTFSPILAKLGMDTDAAIEWSVLNEKMRNLPSTYTYSPELGAMIDMAEKGAPVTINSSLVKDLVQAHISKNGERVNTLSVIRANEGLKLGRDPKIFYPIPRNPKDTPHFAFVIDDSVTGTGHSKMIYAKDGETLEALKRQVMDSSPDLRVLTKQESEDYFKAHGQYEFERTLNENYINTNLSRKGVSSSFLPTTDPKKIITDFLDWHLGRDSSLVRELVSHRYSRQLEVLRASAEPAISAAKSKFGYISPLSYAENTVNNPASNMIKMMLDIQKVEEYPFWTNMNRQLDTKVSEVASNISKLWDKAAHPNDLEAINSALQKAGYGGPIVDAPLYEAMNGKVERGLLTAFVSKANALIGTLALRMDPMNAINNAVGHSVLGGTEAKSVLSAIRAGNSEAVGELAKLGNIRLPGTDDYIFSPTKILANSFSRIQNPELRQWYKDKGFVSSIMDQYDQTLDAIAIRAGDTGKQLNERLQNGFSIAKGAKQVGNLGEKLTGNKVAEEFNRFMAADFMKQITEIAVKHGIMDDKAALSYINTFVNRTNGNFLASQRPILFQGPIGQAIGLFQTYQFNMIQQLLRHVGEGQSKNAATMMGLQATVYGLNGLPGFNAVNTYIVGNASGNTNHTDMYQAIFSGAGKEAGEWLAYGALSNAMGIFDPDLKTNMYTRGDINPRNITIVPVDPSKIPLFQASARFFGNMKDSIEQVGMGAGVWNTMLRGLEQNGVSRPLAGLAQVLGAKDGMVTATNAQGNILMSHDLMNWASVSRLLGAKPMDEAIVQDAMFRNNTYRSHDSAKRASLAEAIKTKILGDGTIEDSDVDKFSETYAKYGGKQNEFNQFITRQYKNASSTQAEQLRAKLNNPFSTQLQRIMGGEDSE